MRKYLLLILASICIGIIIPSKVYAVDISVGASTWYVWWDLEKEGKTVDIDPAFLYGPVLSLKFNDDFNLTFAFLYGKFDLNDPINFGGSKIANEVKRLDIDLALNYKLNDYFKVFAGLKMMNFSFVDTDRDHSGMGGPGLGLSFIFPIYENLFLVANLSGFYLPSGKEGSYTFKEYGVNSTLSIAYYIQDISTTLSLGGRFQYSKSDYETDDYYAPEQDPAKQKFYGITLTATYTF